MRRFETPPAPPGWTGHGATLIRIVDPLGTAIAWLAPDYGGACVGYAIRHDDGAGTRWQQVLRAGSPREWRTDPRAVGIAVLGPSADEPTAASEARWVLVERDPTAATCAARIGPARLFLTARLDAASLHLDLRAEAADEATDGAMQSLALGLHLTCAGDLRLSDEAATGPTLTNDDGMLRLALTATGQDSPHWRVDARGANVGIGIWGESAISIVVRDEA